MKRSIYDDQRKRREWEFFVWYLKGVYEGDSEGAFDLISASRLVPPSLSQASIHWPILSLRRKLRQHELAQSNRVIQISER